MELKAEGRGKDMQARRKGKEELVKIENKDI